jgi:flagellar biosynthesis chaperone FliJ
MSIDNRRFDYALEPVRRQALWRLDALLASLGAVQREIESEQARLETLRARHATSCQVGANASSRRLDPSTYGALLQWLTQLRRLIHSRERVLAELHSRRREIAEQFETQQRKVEAVQKHRGDCLSEFVQMESARTSNEADREWLARLRWAEAHGPGGGVDTSREPTL